MFQACTGISTHKRTMTRKNSNLCGLRASTSRRQRITKVKKWFQFESHSISPYFVKNIKHIEKSSSILEPPLGNCGLMYVSHNMTFHYSFCVISCLPLLSLTMFFYKSQMNVISHYLFFFLWFSSLNMTPSNSIPVVPNIMISSFLTAAKSHIYMHMYMS